MAMDEQTYEAVWAEIMLSAFESWLLTQLHWGELWTDYMTVNAALEDSYSGSFQEAAAAASRLAGVAVRAPFAAELVAFFDGLADAWMLDGGAWRAMLERG
jgi:hypothetical protein